MQEFHLPDMTCGHCSAAVTRALKSADPQAQVEVDLASKTVRVQSQQPRETLAQALVEADYPPR